jgi:deoxyribose-phosphate aldolase
VAAVSTGFPAGLSPFEQRIAEIRASVAAGAEEIDVVITRSHVLTENWRALYDEVRAMREACGDAHIKTILATGELGTLRNVARASLVCMMAGADFIKTSTGKESVNATMPVGLVMARGIRDYRERTGHLIGLKAAGGIRTAREALDWLALVKDELGDRWLRADLFRFGASTLLGDIERQLEHFVTGRYSAAHRHPAG